MENLAKSFQIA